MAPEFVDRMRGSKCVQAQPAGKSRETGEFGNSNLWFPNSSPEPAEAGGSGHCPVKKAASPTFPRPYSQMLRMRQRRPWTEKAVAEEISMGTSRMERP